MGQLRAPRIRHRSKTRLRQLYGVARCWRSTRPAQFRRRPLSRQDVHGPRSAGFSQWAGRDSNLRPTDYDSVPGALADRLWPRPRRRHRLPSPVSRPARRGMSLRVIPAACGSPSMPPFHAAKRGERDGRPVALRPPVGGHRRHLHRDPGAPVHRGADGRVAGAAANAHRRDALSAAGEPPSRRVFPCRSRRGGAASRSARRLVWGVASIYSRSAERQAHRRGR